MKIILLVVSLIFFAGAFYFSTIPGYSYNEIRRMNIKYEQYQEGGVAKGGIEVKVTKDFKGLYTVCLVLGSLFCFFLLMSLFADVYLKRIHNLKNNSR